jgi:hypothetical protein
MSAPMPIPSGRASAEKMTAAIMRAEGAEKQMEKQDSEETRISTSARSDMSVEVEKSIRTTFSHVEPSAGFQEIAGEVGGTGYNETTVDIVTVPCPGAHPVETWARDPFPPNYFNLPLVDDDDHLAIKELVKDAILNPAIDRVLPKAPHIWVRQGIRQSADIARVALYRHRELSEDTTLEQLAGDLLEHVMGLREGLKQSRPLFFIAHSVGGLVVKQAIVMASLVEKYRGIWYNCHGVTFFGKS